MRDAYVAWGGPNGGSPRLAGHMGGGDDVLVGVPSSLYDAAAPSPFSSCLPGHKAKAIYFSRAATTAAAAAASAGPQSTSYMHAKSFLRRGTRSTWSKGRLRVGHAGGPPADGLVVVRLSVSSLQLQPVCDLVAFGALQWPACYRPRP